MRSTCRTSVLAAALLLVRGGCGGGPSTSADQPSASEVDADAADVPDTEEQPPPADADQEDEPAVDPNDAERDDAPSEDAIEDEAAEQDDEVDPDGADGDRDVDAEDGDDAFAVPGRIDEAYVDRVVAEIFAQDDQVAGAILSREPGEGGRASEVARLETLYSGPRLQAVRSEYSGYASRAEDREGLLDAADRGAKRWRTSQVVHGDASCVIAVGEYDLTEVAVQPLDDDLRLVLSLRRDRSLLQNPTGWTIHDVNALITVDGELVDEEYWPELDYDSFLETTCDEEWSP